MFKLWAKLYDEKNNMIKNESFEFKQEFDAMHLPFYMQVICNEWTMETPLVLKSHVKSFAYFNHVKFIKSDFIDTIDFKFLKVQIIS